MVTLTTHSFLAYEFDLTVKHILFDCDNFIEARNTHFNANRAKKSFGKFFQKAFYLISNEFGLLYGNLTHFKNFF